MIDWTITVGNILETVTIAVGGLGFMYTLKGRLGIVETRLDYMQAELKKMADVIVNQARIEERMLMIEKALDHIEKG